MVIVRRFHDNFSGRQNLELLSAPEVNQSGRSSALRAELRFFLANFNRLISNPHGALAVTDRKKMHASTGRFEVAGVLDI